MFCPRCRTFTDYSAASKAFASDSPADNAGSGPQKLEPQRDLGAAADKLRASLNQSRGWRAQSDRRRCAACGTLLTFDRMAAEFPSLRADGGESAGAEAAMSAPPASGEPKKDAAVSGNSTSSALPPDAPVTVQDILRATAGPNPISGVGQIPLDQRQPGSGDRRGPGTIGGRRREDAGYVASRYQASETANRRNRERRQRELDADWRDSDSPRIPRGFGRSLWPKFNLEVVLGIGTLAAVALLVVSMTLRVILAPNDPAAPMPHPMAKVVNASALGYMPALAAAAPKPHTASAQPVFSPFASFTGFPTFIGNHWRRMDLPGTLPLTPHVAVNQIRMDVASYSSLGLPTLVNPAPVQLWVQRFRSDADAAVGLAQLIQRHQHLLVAQSPAPLSVRWEAVAGQNIAVFDNAAGAQLASDTPGEIVACSVRIWQQGSNLITAAGANPVAADAFARDYITRAS